jgi:hypothetical protein
MNKNNSIKDAIKNLVAKFSADEKEIQFSEMKTVDGKILRADAFLASNKVQEITEEGERNLLAGDYELDNGLIIAVNEDSVIAEVKEKATEEEVAEAPAEFAKKVNKRFSATKKFAEDAEGVESEGEVTIVAEVIEKDATVIVIDEKLAVDEKYNGELSVMIDETLETIVIEEGVITEIVEPAEEEVAEDEVVTEDFSKDILSVLENVLQSNADLKSKLSELEVQVATFAKLPAAVSTDTKIKLKETKDEAPKSVLHTMIKK